MPTQGILLEAGTNEVEIVVFSIDEETDGTGAPYTWHFGVNVAKVLEITRMPQYTAMPESAHFSVLGAFRQRGRIIPLIDLGLWLGLQLHPNELEKVLVTEFNKVVTAFKVSNVHRIYRLSWEAIEPPSNEFSKLCEHSITGVIQLDKMVVFVLDLEKIVGDISPETAISFQNAEEAAEGQVEGRIDRALVVDDSPTARKMIIQLLEQAGFETTFQVNGRDAWEWVQQQKEKAQDSGKHIHEFVNVIISDIEMPQMDGHSLTKRIKSDPMLQDIPVILFSSLITDGLLHKGKSVGADLQVAKPDLGIVASTARKLIAKYRP